MNAVVMMFFGAGMGMGLLLLVQALRPQSQPIHEVFASVATEGRGYTETARDRSQRSFRDTVGSVGSTLAIASSDEAQLRKDLAVTASTMEQHGLVKASAPAFVLLGAYVIWLLLAALGLGLHRLSPQWQPSERHLLPLSSLMSGCGPERKREGWPSAMRSRRISTW